MLNMILFHYVVYCYAAKCKFVWHVLNRSTLYQDMETMHKWVIKINHESYKVHGWKLKAENVKILKLKKQQQMPGSRRFCQRGSNFDSVLIIYLFIYLFYEGREDPSTTMSGPPSVWLAADDGATLNAVLVAAIFQGIRTCIAWKTYIFCDFSGLGVPDPLSPIWIRTCKQQTNMQYALKIDIVKCVWLTCSCDSRRQIL